MRASHVFEAAIAPLTHHYQKQKGGGMDYFDDSSISIDFYWSEEPLRPLGKEPGFSQYRVQTMSPLLKPEK